MGNWRFGVPRSTKMPVGFYVESAIPDFLRSVPGLPRFHCTSRNSSMDRCIEHFAKKTSLDNSANFLQ